MNFNGRVYEVVKQIPKGNVSTYKQIGEIINSRAYRAIGQALKKNPNPILIPCHRVVRNNGEIGGYFGEVSGKGLERKIKLLGVEGVEVKNNKIVDFENKKLINKFFFDCFPK